MANDKKRMVSTHFWNDTFVVDLDPIEKLLFLYLLTNDQTNMLGVYEISLRRMSFDTGIDKDMVLKIMDRFKKSDRAEYCEGYVILYNFMRHQKFNKNMVQSALNTLKELPDSVISSQGFQRVVKGFETHTQGFEIYKREIEIEKEIEKESEIQEKSTKKESAPDLSPSKEEWMNYCSVHGYNPSYAEHLFEHMEGVGWKDQQGRSIHKWTAYANKSFKYQENFLKSLKPNASNKNGYKSSARQTTGERIEQIYNERAETAH